MIHAIDETIFLGNFNINEYNFCDADQTTFIRTLDHALNKNSITNKDVIYVIDKYKYDPFRGKWNNTNCSGRQLAVIIEKNVKFRYLSAIEFEKMKCNCRIIDTFRLPDK